MPKGVSRKGYGARTHALVSLLTSKYRMSKRQVQDWFNDIYKMPISLGSVSNIEGTSSLALETVHVEIGNMAKKSSVMHADETGHKQKNKNGWAWVLSTMKHTFFILRQSRGRKIARELIGSYVGKVIVTDRYSAYGYIPDKNHQVCWAHLKRDIQKIAEREGRPGEIGRYLLRIYGKVFGFWKQDLKERPVFDGRQKRRARYLQNLMRRALIIGAECKHKKTARTCKNILACEDSLWQFFKIVGVPPTNNHAERQLRPLVISKKLTFGTQSQRGSQFIERIFSVVMTCRQQKKDVLNFLKETISNAFSNQPALSLA